MSTWVLNTIYSSDELFERDVSFVNDVLAKHPAATKDGTLQLQEAGKTLKELEAFVECLLAQDPSDPGAHQKSAEISELLSKYDGALFSLASQFAQMEEEQFLALQNELSMIGFYLKELREFARKKGAQSTEEIITLLSTEGYHGYWSLYQVITGKMKVGPRYLSVGQAYNELFDHNREKRLQAFADWEKAWSDQSDYLAIILNHIAGFRLKVYGLRKWEDPLFEPLFLNRMQQKTLDVMWDVINRAKPIFVKYLERKAELLGVEKLAWVDVEAPLFDTEKIGWDQGCQMVIESFGAFHAPMAQFAQEAFQKRWVESEDRKGKAAGGFCVSFPKSSESRIFMTYKGTANNVATLAHELGHAYHNECVKTLPYFHQIMQMNVAETASTFAEMIVIEQTKQLAKSKEEKLQLLDDKILRAVMFFMNLHSRVLFEKLFYEERKQGFVGKERLCDLMVSAQKEAFCDALATWDPYFWASKLHFYYTYVPFYNFPYTFGYMLSSGLYERMKNGGLGSKFDAFLHDTAQMQVEDLAKKHLDVDLGTPQFWEEALKPLKEDVEEYLQLSVF